MSADRPILPSSLRVGDEFTAIVDGERREFRVCHKGGGGIGGWDTVSSCLVDGASHFANLRDRDAARLAIRVVRKAGE